MCEVCEYNKCVQCVFVCVRMLMIIRFDGELEIKLTRTAGCFTIVCICIVNDTVTIKMKFRQQQLITGLLNSL